jgi:hypothetical protein
MMDGDGFKRLAQRLAAAWDAADTQAALDCFTPNGVYMQPPNAHIFVGHEELRGLFSDLRPGNNWQWHDLWFDRVSQKGVGEFTFLERVAHGVAVLELRDRRIAVWREYQWHGSMSWHEFISPEKSRYRVTFANYGAGELDAQQLVTLRDCEAKGENN